MQLFQFRKALHMRRVREALRHHGPYMAVLLVRAY